MSRSTRSSAPPPPAYEEEEEDDYEYDDDPAPRYLEMITDGRHFSHVPLGGADTLDRSLSCAVCLGFLRAPMATECLHRFCSECIETSIRLGKKECPSCRFPIATRRALRRDLNFEALMLTLFPGGVEEEDDEEDYAANLAQFKFVPLRPAGYQPARSPSPSGPAAPPAVEPSGRSKEGSGKAGATGRSPKPKAQPSSSAPDDTTHGSTAEKRGVGRGKKAQAEEDDGIHEPPPSKWSCAICTLINSAAAKKCKACQAPNPTVKAKKAAATAQADDDDEDRPLRGPRATADDASHASPALPSELRRMASNTSTCAPALSNTSRGVHLSLPAAAACCLLPAACPVPVRPATCVVGAARRSLSSSLSTRSLAGPATAAG